jgi:hypothetical protein
VVLIRALVAVIHAVLRAAADSLLAGFSLLIMAIVIVLILGALVAAIAGGLGLGGVHWIRRRKHSGESDDND